MGTPSSKLRRKKKEFKVNKEKQQKALNLVSSINQQPSQESVVSRPVGPRVEQKAQPKVNDKNIDLNSLPRQSPATEKIIRAIDDVNKRISKSVGNKRESIDQTDNEIDNLVNKVKQKMKYEQKRDNKTNISHYYSKLSKNSPSDLCSNRLTLNQKQKDLVVRDLQRLDKVEDKKSINLNRERLSLLKRIKSDSDSELGNEEALLKARRDLTRIKPLSGLNDTYSKSYSAIRPLGDLFDAECSEPIYDKPNDLRQIDIRSDADFLQISKRCKTIQDMYKIDSGEIKQIIEFIEQKDRENGDKSSGCSYYMKGNEIYSAVPSADFNAPKLADKRCSNGAAIGQENNKIVKQILHDLVLNYELENQSKVATSKKVHFNKESCFRPIQADKNNDMPTSSCDDTMPNVTKFIESLEKQDRN